MKTVKLEPLTNIQGKPLKDRDKNGVEVDASLLKVLEVFIFNVPTLSMEDSVQAQRYFTQIDNQNVNGSFSLEDAQYEWLVDKVNSQIHLTVGPNAVKFKEAVRNLVEG